jgi:TonB family protein
VKDIRPKISGMKIHDPLLEEPKNPQQRLAMWLGGGLAAIGVHIIAGFVLMTVAPLLQIEHQESTSDAVEMEVVDQFEEIPEPDPEPEPAVEEEPEPEPEPEPEVVKPEPKPEPSAEPPPEAAPPIATEAMDPVNLEGLTLESTSDSGGMAIKVGTGITTGKITNKYVDPKRFGNIKTAEGGTGEGYGDPAPASVAPKKCAFVKPEAIKKVKGVYPAEARRRQIEGNVVALVSISAQGRVTDVKVVTSVGYGLDESATEAFKAWTFKPAQKDCVAVDYKLRLTHTFSMEDN